jgi:hypothetical protein
MSDGTLIEEQEPSVETREAKSEREKNEIKEVRASDIEPYTGLGYLSKLFRFMAVILILLLVAEVATGVYTQGSASIPTLLGEASRLIVLAGVLWGTGDLAHLLIDVGHDVRAARILMARIAHVAKVAPLTVTRSSNDRSVERVTEVPVIDRSVAPRSALADRNHAGASEPPIP